MEKVCSGAIAYLVFMKEDNPKDGEHKLEVPNPRPPAIFIADDPGLDFLNSIGTPAGTVIEWLANGEDLLAWLEQRHFPLEWRALSNGVEAPCVNYRKGNEYEFVF